MFATNAAGLVRAEDSREDGKLRPHVQRPWISERQRKRALDLRRRARPPGWTDCLRVEQDQAVTRPLFRKLPKERTSASSGHSSTVAMFLGSAIPKGRGGTGRKHYLFQVPQEAY